MTLYKFKTFKSTYYFPQWSKKSGFIYSLYGNYGGKVAHIVWWLFCHSYIYRWINRVDAQEVDGYATLHALLGKDCEFGINMGTNGPDQKKSVLGYERSSGRQFFAKLATKERAMALSRNEIKVYKLLADTGLAPKLYDYKDEKDFVFLKCECINGQHVHGQIDNRQILDILLTLKQKHYSPTPSSSSTPSTSSTSSTHSTPSTSSTHSTPSTSFAHMDFCPWNMIDINGKLHIIDWEMAAEMPLGFDLFTYLLQTHFLTDNSKTGEEVINENRTLIDEYFQGVDWTPYLKAFIDYKIEFFSAGQNSLLLERFREMKHSLSSPLFALSC